MSAGALAFMISAWGIIIGAVALTLSQLVKHSK